MKSQIIGRLGQENILRPVLIVEGLAANDRVTAGLSFLQAEVGHARKPHGARFHLIEECRASGIDPLELEAVVDAASPLCRQNLIPRLSAVNISEMAKPC